MLPHKILHPKGLDIKILNPKELPLKAWRCGSEPRIARDT